MSFVHRSRSAVLLLSRIVAANAAQPGRIVTTLKGIRLFNYAFTESRRRRLATPLIGAAFGFSLHAMADKSAEIHQKADELFDSNRFDELLQYLTEQESWYDNGELLWRVARAKFQLSKTEKDDKKRGELVKNAYDNVRRSLELNNECGPAHKVRHVRLHDHRVACTAHECAFARADTHL